MFSLLAESTFDRKSIALPVSAMIFGRMLFICVAVKVFVVSYCNTYDALAWSFTKLIQLPRECFNCHGKVF